MKNSILYILSIAILFFGNACDDNNNDNGDATVEFSELVLSVEVTNKLARRIVVDNATRRINFDLARNETRENVGIKLTLAEGVSMVDKQEQDYYDLTNPAEIKLSAGGHTVVFIVRVVGFFDPVSEFINSAEIINKHTRNIVVDNDTRKISFDLSSAETRNDVNIKLTLAEGVSMVEPEKEQDFYDLSALNSTITLSVEDGRIITFSVAATLFDPISEFILSAEVTNRDARDLHIDTDAKEITFDLSVAESKSGVNIKLTLADGVAMVSPATPQADYNLTTPAQIILFADKREVIFTVTAGSYDPNYINTAALLIEKGWTEQTQFGQLKEGIKVYKAPATFKGASIVAYLALGEVDKGINFHVLTANYDETARQVHGTKTPTQFHNENNGEFTIITNGTYWWWDTNSGRSRNTGLIHRNGLMIEPTPRTVTRNSLTYYVTRGVFSELANKQYRTDWAYTTNVTNRTTYAYPAPLPNVLGQPPLSTPTANFPAGGWLYSAQTAIGGGPLLIKNGVIENKVEAELFDPASTIEPYTRQPRTAIGFTGDRRIALFVLEGRSSASSGLTLQEVAEFLLEIGCVELLNLDGGGSSCMLVNGQTTIRPSDL